MSIEVPRCEACGREREFEKLGPFPDQANESLYGVGWRCRSCNTLTLDLCPVGPLAPTADSCLNCGDQLRPEADAQCRGCGMSRADLVELFGLESLSGDPVTAAESLLAKGLVRRGLALVNHALQRDVSIEPAWGLKLTFLHRLGFKAAELAMLREAVARGAPAALLISYGCALEESGAHEDAISAYRQYLEREPEGRWASAACGNQANSLAALGDHSAAQTLYRKAISLDPTEPAHRANYLSFLKRRSFAFAEQDDGEGALDAADAALGLAPEDPGAHYLRGRALGILGRLAEARQEMAAVLTRSPDHADAKRAIGLIEAAMPRKPWWRPW